MHELRNDLPFLLVRIKIEKVEKLVANLHDKTEYVIYIINLRQALNHGSVLKKFIISLFEFNQATLFQLTKSYSNFEQCVFTSLLSQHIKKIS